MPFALRLSGERLDDAALEQSLQVLVERHPSLRTSFFSVDGTPWQRIEDVQFVMHRVDLAPLPAEERLEEAMQRASPEGGVPLASTKRRFCARRSIGSTTTTCSR